MFKILNSLYTALFLFCCFSSSPLMAVWEAPVTISTTTSNEPQIGISASGYAVSIWNEFDGVNTNIQSATLDKGESWSSPITISSVTGNNPQAYPQIAVDLAGNAVAVWEEFNGTSVIKASTLPLFGSWSTPITISSPTTDGSQIPQVAVDDFGNAVAVWMRHNGFFNIVQSAVLPFGGSWSSPADVSSLSIDSFSPQVDVDASGNAVAVWTNVTSQIIQGATLPFGGSWTSSVNISSASDLSNIPLMTVDSSGNATAIWTGFNGTDFLIQSSTLPFGGSWTSPVDISAIGTISFASQVTADPSGNAIAIWNSVIGSDIITQAATLPFGGSWSSPVNLSASGGQAFDSQVSTDSSGNAIAIWDRFDGINVIIQAAMLPFGGNWSVPVDISTVGQDSDFPKIAIDPSGYAVVNWTNETLNVIQSALWIPAPTVINVNPNVGPTTGTNSVTITGTNFINVSNVLFGSTSASSFALISSTTIIALAPAGTGTVDVTVTTSSGTSSTSIDDHYTYGALPQVNRVTPGNGPTAGGHTVRITGANFNNVSAVKFGSFNAVSFTVISPTLIVATTPPGSSGTVDVTVTTNIGTSAGTARDHYTYHP